MKHKVRDRVRIRPDLRTDIKYGEGEAVDEMYALRGQIVTINEVDTEGEYYLMEEDEGYFCWTDEMFEDSMTNGDMIRALSDEELADWLVEVYENTKNYGAKVNKLWVVNSKTDVHHILDGVKVLIIQWNIVFRISWMIMKTKKRKPKTWNGSTIFQKRITG